MAVATADIQSHLTDLCDDAFEAFCEDVSSMFGTDITCQREHVGLETVANLRRRFKKLTAVHVVRATGLLDGEFQLLFDQGGLFVLSGVIVMLPEARILQQVKNGHADDAENLTDAAREVGNLLVGSWDRIFREGCEEHKHFVKASTFIGKPWDNPGEVSLSAEDEVLLAVYEMTVESFPSFCCAALFPKALLEQSSQSEASDHSEPENESEPESQAPAPVEARPQEKVEPPAPSAKAEAPEPPAAKDTQAKPTKAATTEPPVDHGRGKPEAASPPPKKPQPPSPKPVAEAETPAEPKKPKPASAAKPVRTAAPTSVAANESSQSPEPTIGIFSDKRAAALIDEIFEEHAVYPGDKGIRDLLNAPARDVMTKQVVWCDPDDSVQDVLTAMQQHNTGYVLVGRDGRLEGLVSTSNILGAISPYLRPTFGKWRRPEDDATLGIKIKWVMTRPVRTIKPDASLGTMIESMRRYGGRCLPVMDGQGTIQGIVTVFDVMLRVLEADQSSSWKGSPPQGPGMMV